MRVAPISSISAAVQVQALAAAQASLLAAMTDTAPVEPVTDAQIHTQTQAQRQGFVAEAADVAETAEAPSQAAPAPAAPPPPADPARAAVSQARASAAASQASLAPMFADMAAALNAPGTPPQLRTALANVLSLRTPIGGAFTGAQLQQAVSQSGLMLEAKLATGAPPIRDLKAALLTLLGTLKTLPQPAAPQEALQPLAAQAGRQTPPPGQTAPPAAGQPPATAPQQPPPSQALRQPLPPPQPSSQQLSPQPPQTELRSEPPTQQLNLPRNADRPPPPVRDGAVRAQPAEVSSLPAARSGDVAPRLEAEVERAVARQVLHQIASLPQGHDGQTWMFELPLLTAQGAMLAQFAIHRDDEDAHGAAREGEGGPAWRARFALDVEPLGPVHVDLRMGGAHRSHVTLWGGETAMARLAPDTDVLGRLLDADVALRPGAPQPEAPAAPGQFLDRRS